MSTTKFHTHTCTVTKLTGYKYYKFFMFSNLLTFGETNTSQFFTTTGFIRCITSSQCYIAFFIRLMTMTQAQNVTNLINDANITILNIQIVHRGQCLHIFRKKKLLVCKTSLLYRRYTTMWCSCITLLCQDSIIKFLQTNNTLTQRDAKHPI